MRTRNTTLIEPSVAGDGNINGRLLVGVQRREPSHVRFWLAALMVSYFYAVPLGRISHVAATDLRLYDVVFGLTFFLVVLPRARAIITAIRRTRWLRVYFLFCLVCLASLSVVFVLSGFSSTFIAAGRLARFVAYGIFAASLTALVRTQRTATFFLFLLLAAIAFQAILSLGQSLGRVPQFWPDYWLYFGDLPVGTLSPHHLHMGMVCVLGFSIALAVLVQRRKPLMKLLFGSILALTVYASFAVGSRTAWLCFPVSFLMILPNVVRKRGVLVVAPFAWLILGIVAIQLFASDQLIGTAAIEWERRVGNPFAAGGVVGLSTTRVELISDLPRVIVSNPWLLVLGTGIQNAGGVLRYGNAMHNNYLHALVETGILGFSLYLLLCWVIFKQIATSFRLSQCAEGRVAALAGLGGFGAVLVANVFNEAFYMQYSMMSLSGQVLALVALATHPVFRRQESEPVLAGVADHRAMARTKLLPKSRPRRGSGSISRA